MLWILQLALEQIGTSYKKTLQKLSSCRRGKNTTITTTDFPSTNLYFTHRSNFSTKERNCCAYTNQALSNLCKSYLNSFFFQYLSLHTPFLFLTVADYCNRASYFLILHHKILCKQSKHSSCHIFRQLNKVVKFFLNYLYC